MESGEAYDAEFDRIQQAEEHGREIPVIYVCLDERCPFESDSIVESMRHKSLKGHVLVQRR